MDWSIAIEATGPGAVDDAALGRLVDALDPHAGVVTSHDAPPRWGARISVDADTPTEAIRWATQIVETAASAAGLPAWPVVRIEAQRGDELDRELAGPNPMVPDLVGVAEIGAMLGVSRQRASEIQTLAGFPVPLARLKAGPVWRRHDVQAWADTWQRQPGRPRKSTA